MAQRKVSIVNVDSGGLMLGGLPTGTPANNLPGHTRASPGRRRSSLLGGMGAANPAARRHSLVGARGDVAAGGGGARNALGLQIAPGKGAKNWDKVKVALDSRPLGALTELMKLREGQSEEDMDAGGDRQRRRHSLFDRPSGQSLHREASVTFDGVPPVFDAIKLDKKPQYAEGPHIPRATVMALAIEQGEDAASSLPAATSKPGSTSPKKSVGFGENQVTEFVSIEPPSPSKSDGSSEGGRISPNSPERNRLKRARTRRNMQNSLGIPMDVATELDIEDLTPRTVEMRATHAPRHCERRQSFSYERPKDLTYLLPAEIDSLLGLSHWDGPLAQEKIPEGRDERSMPPHRFWHPRSSRRGGARGTITSTGTIDATGHVHLDSHDAPGHVHSGRRKSFGGFPFKGSRFEVERTLFHEMREFYDPQYRVYLLRKLMHNVFQKVWTRGEMDLLPLWRRMQEVAELFAWIDIDGTGEIDKEELSNALLKLNMRVRGMELDNLFEICDPDMSGTIDIEEFSSWYFSTSDDWTAKRRQDPDDTFNDNNLLRRESIRFHPQMQRLMESFWQIVNFEEEVEGIVPVMSKDEYIMFNMNLQRHVVEDLNEDEFDEMEAYEVATREWEFDSKGKEVMTREDFALAVFQMADAWADSIDPDAYCTFLDQLMQETTNEAPSDEQTRHPSGVTRTWKFSRSMNLDDRLNAAKRRRNGLLRVNNIKAKVETKRKSLKLSVMGAMQVAKAMGKFMSRRGSIHRNKYVPEERDMDDENVAAQLRDQLMNDHHVNRNEVDEVMRRMGHLHHIHKHQQEHMHDVQLEQHPEFRDDSKPAASRASMLVKVRTSSRDGVPNGRDEYNSDKPTWGRAGKTFKAGHTEETQYEGADYMNQESFGKANKGFGFAGTQTKSRLAGQYTQGPYVPVDHGGSLNLNSATDAWRTGASNTHGEGAWHMLRADRGSVDENAHREEERKPMTPIERLQRPTSSFRQMSKPRSSFVADSKGGRKSIPLVINHPMPSYQYAGFDSGTTGAGDTERSRRQSRKTVKYTDSCGTVEMPAELAAELIEQEERARNEVRASIRKATAPQSEPIDSPPAEDRASLHDPSPQSPEWDDGTVAFEQQSALLFRRATANPRSPEPQPRELASAPEIAFTIFQLLGGFEGATNSTHAALPVTKMRRLQGMLRQVANSLKKMADKEAAAVRARKARPSLMNLADLVQAINLWDHGGGAHGDFGGGSGGQRRPFSRDDDQTMGRSMADDSSLGLQSELARGLLSMVSQEELEPSAPNLFKVARKASERFDQAIAKIERTHKKGVPNGLFKGNKAPEPVMKAPQFVAALATSSTKPYIGKSKFQNATQALSGDKTLIAAARKMKAAGTESGRHGQKEWELDPTLVDSSDDPEIEPKRSISTSTPASRSRLAREMRAKCSPARAATVRPKLQLESGIGSGGGGGGGDDDEYLRRHSPPQWELAQQLSHMHFAQLGSQTQSLSNAQLLAISKESRTSSSQFRPHQPHQSGVMYQSRQRLALEAIATMALTKSNFEAQSGSPVDWVPREVRPIQREMVGGGTQKARPTSASPTGTRPLSVLTLQPAAIGADGVKVGGSAMDAAHVEDVASMTSSKLSPAALFLKRVATDPDDLPTKSKGDGGTFTESMGGGPSVCDLGSLESVGGQARSPPARGGYTIAKDRETENMRRVSPVQRGFTTGTASGAALARPVQPAQLSPQGGGTVTSRDGPTTGWYAHADGTSAVDEAIAGGEFELEHVGTLNELPTPDLLNLLAAAEGKGPQPVPPLHIAGGAVGLIGT